MYIQPRRGAIIRTHDDDGHVLLTPEREADRIPPSWDEIGSRIQRTLALLGGGNLHTGLERIAVDLPLDARVERQMWEWFLAAWREAASEEDAKYGERAA